MVEVPSELSMYVDVEPSLYVVVIEPSAFVLVPVGTIAEASVEVEPVVDPVAELIASVVLRRRLRRRRAASLA